MSQRLADVTEKKRAELEKECSWLTCKLAALQQKVATLNAANEVHIQNTSELQLALGESTKTVRYLQTQVEQLKSEIERVKSGNHELKADNAKLKSDYEHLRQCATEVVGLMPSGHIQDGDPGETGRGGNPATVGIEPATSGPEKEHHTDTAPSQTFSVNEATQKERMLEDEEDEFDGQISEPRNDFDLSMYDEDCKYIRLEKRGVAVMPDFSRFSKLENLALHDNLLTAIRDGSMPRTLVNLDIWDNKIEEIRGLDALTNLTGLRLSNNLLRKITANHVIG
ncbi:Leucine Rich Repeat family protein [Aphelenchoides avenae]|nr:Leucine Rich Repeat family protein [Aphelenchus avenae]